MDHLGKKRLIQLKRLECKLLPPNCSGMDDWTVVFLLELICSQYSHRIYYRVFFLIILSEQLWSKTLQRKIKEGLL